MGLDVEQLYRKYGPMVLRRCRQLLRDEHAAQDALHDVFVLALDRADGLRQDYPSSLLYTMATNHCLNRLRERTRHPVDRDEEILLNIASQDEGHEGFVWSNLLDRLFGREQASTRTMAVLHYLDGFTLEQVAKETGLSVSGVRKRLRVLRDRAQLQEIEA
jgi:RNA polymerase sigma-70 factor (ECF subfamily)